MLLIFNIQLNSVIDVIASIIIIIILLYYYIIIITAIASYSSFRPFPFLETRTFQYACAIEQAGILYNESKQLEFNALII